MAKPPKVQPPQTSLFPFFPEKLAHPMAGLVLASVYFVAMLFVGMKYHTVGDYNVETDFFWGYVPEAREILRGHFIIEDFRGPGYPILLATVGLIFKDFFLSGIFLSTFAAACVLWFSFETLKRLFRSDIAFMGTLLVAVNRTFITYTYTAGTDMVFNAFVAGSAFFLLRNENRRWSDIVLFATFSAFAYLTRYNGIFIVLAVPAVFLLMNIHRLEWAARIRTSLVALGAFFLCIAPWGVYCFLEKGSFFYNRNYLNIAYEMFAKGKIPWDQYWNVEANKFSSLSQVIVADPALFVGTVLTNLYDHFASDLNLLLGWQAGILVVAGIALSLKEKPSTRQLAYYVYGICFFLVLLLVFYGERFSMFLLPLYASLALKPLSWQRLSGFRFWGRMQIGAVIALVVLVWTAADSYAFNRLNINSGPQEIPVIAEVFKKNFGDAERGKVIFARKPHIAYYLDMKMESFPYVSSWEELKAKARELNASYLFYGLMEAGLRPQFQELLDPRNAPPWLRPLTYTVAPPAVLYKIELPTP
jgi:hypothetical protein